MRTSPSNTRLACYHRISSSCPYTVCGEVFVKSSLVSVLSIVIFGLSCACVLETFEGSDQIGRSTSPIVGGRLANEAELYSTVAIFYTDYGTTDCTGTLIAPDVVVTAAHCITDYDFGDPLPAEYLLVISGQLEAISPLPASTYRVSQVIAHESYDPWTPVEPDQYGLARWYDIGLLVLTEPVDGATPAPIPSVEEFDQWVFQGTELIIEGYGVTDEWAEDGGVLYVAETPYQRRNDSELVAGAAGYPDTCFGDSGGPLYLPIEGGWALLGVTSRAAGPDLSSCGSGGVYTWTSAYREWIESRSGGRWTPDLSWPEEDQQEEPRSGCRCNASSASSSRAWPFSLLFLLFFRFGLKGRS